MTANTVLVNTKILENIVIFLLRQNIINIIDEKKKEEMDKKYVLINLFLQAYKHNEWYKLLTRLLILLAQIKAGNNSHKLKNEIRKILCLL